MNMVFLRLEQGILFLNGHSFKFCECIGIFNYVHLTFALLEVTDTLHSSHYSLFFFFVMLLAPLHEHDKLPHPHCTGNISRAM